jgi:hypothetical protein
VGQSGVYCRLQRGNLILDVTLYLRSMSISFVCAGRKSSRPLGVLLRSKLITFGSARIGYALQRCFQLALCRVCRGAAEPLKPPAQNQPK